MTYNLLIAIHAFVSRVSISVSVDDTLLLRSVNLSTSFRELPFSVDKRTKKLGNKRTSKDSSNDNIIKIGQNTKKSSGELRIFAVTLIPVRTHQVTLLETKNFLK